MDKTLGLLPYFKTLRRLGAAVLVFLSAALVVFSSFELGLSVSVGGETLGGAYRAGDVLYSLNSVAAASTELLEGSVELGGTFSVKPRLFRGEAASAEGLAVSLMEHVPGVEYMCGVYVEGELVGWVHDPSELGELLNAILSGYAEPYTVYLGFEEAVDTRYGYVSEAELASAAHAAAALREHLTVEVINAVPSSELISG